LETTVLTIHIVICVLLILLVLLQSGKEGMGVIFGGGSSSLFGSTGAGGLLVKLTAVAALIFLVTSLSYNMLTSSKMSKESSIIDIEVNDPSAAPKTTAPAGNATLPSSVPALPRLDAPTSPASAPAQAAIPPAQAAPAPDDTQTPNRDQRPDATNATTPR
jgi:preprotein translocase subunit SecG